MSFLSDLDDSASGGRYARLGYARNPFPIRGQVWPAVYVERAELRDVQLSLLSFLRGEGAGRLWAIAGSAGLGKSNFLQHVELELKQLVDSDKLSGLAYRYIASQQVSPRFLAQEVVQAIGEEAIRRLIEKQSGAPSVARGTDFGRFLDAAGGRAQAHAQSDAQFACRWLGGHQTYADERRIFGIHAKTRLAPAVGVSYLRVLLDALADEGIVDRLVLLLDEFEDVQALRRDVQNEYLMALKGLVNAFNWERLFVILAGQEAAFTTLGQRIPSLQSRWQMIQLLPIGSTSDAVRLAEPYKALARRQYIGKNPSVDADPQMRPTDAEVKAVFADTMASRRLRHMVSPRALLHELHAWVEATLESEDARR